MLRSSALAALLLVGVAPGAAIAASPAGSGSLPRDPWRRIAPGVQSASAGEVGGDPSWSARVLLIDPRFAVVSVQFDPESPTIAQWRTRFPDAIAIANGSFYSADERRGAVRPTCDLVLAGSVVRGAGCRRQDALFFGAQPASPPPGQAAPTRPPGGRRQGGAAPPARAASAGAAPGAGAPAAPGTRAGPPAPAATAEARGPACAVAGAGPRLLPPAEFRPAEWIEALKSFPALVRQCQPSCPGPHYCQERSRTAALGLLRDGRVLLFASQGPAVRREVGRFLADSLGAAEAVNLDGGPEATLALRGEFLQDSIGLAGTGLPLVLVILPRARW